MKKLGPEKSAGPEAQISFTQGFSLVSPQEGVGRKGRRRNQGEDRNLNFVYRVTHTNFVFVYTFLHVLTSFRIFINYMI